MKVFCGCVVLFIFCLYMDAKEQGSPGQQKLRACIAESRNK